MIRDTSEPVISRGTTEGAKMKDRTTNGVEQTMPTSTATLFPLRHRIPRMSGKNTAAVYMVYENTIASIIVGITKEIRRASSPKARTEILECVSCFLSFFADIRSTTMWDAAALRSESAVDIMAPRTLTTKSAPGTEGSPERKPAISPDTFVPRNAGKKLTPTSRRAANKEAVLAVFESLADSTL